MFSGAGPRGQISGWISRPFRDPISNGWLQVLDFAFERRLRCKYSPPLSCSGKGVRFPNSSRQPGQERLALRHGGEGCWEVERFPEPRLFDRWAGTPLGNFDGHQRASRSLPSPFHHDPATRKVGSLRPQKKRSAQRDVQPDPKEADAGYVAKPGQLRTDPNQAWEHWRITPGGASGLIGTSGLGAGPPKRNGPGASPPRRRVGQQPTIVLQKKLPPRGRANPRDLPQPGHVQEWADPIDRIRGSPASAAERHRFIVRPGPSRLDTACDLERASGASGRTRKKTSRGLGEESVMKNGKNLDQRSEGP